jgi:hypothetical protein
LPESSWYKYPVLGQLPLPGFGTSASVYEASGYEKAGALGYEAVWSYKEAGMWKHEVAWD